ncbi:MAG: right-handed parallel beta-helix repeat-containing protein [Acidobacteria bacterium]|nr:right-handed parallel beta-helix repeat-containing protein [Acidobacteriota bacterium]
MNNIAFPFLFLLSCAAAGAIELEVSPHGRLNSLEAARDRIRELKRNGLKEPVTVVLRAGTYRLDRPFVLKPEDSGTPEHPIVYTARPGERVVISGGRVISGWRKGEGSLWTMQLDDVRNGSLYFRQLFIQGNRAQRARTPNLGYYRIEGPSSKAELFRLKYSGGNIQKQWAGSEAEVVVLLEWTEIRRPIVKVEEAQRIAVLAGNMGGTAIAVPWEVDARYFIENAPDGLDSAGEWRLDRKTGILSYWPAGGGDLAQQETVVPALRQLVRLEGQPEQARFVRNVTFRGLEFRHTDWTMGPEGYGDNPQAAAMVPAAFDAVGARDCAVEACTFANLGGYALWFGRGAKGNRLVGNHVFDTGAGGIKIGDAELHHADQERSSGNTVTDNHLHNLGVVYPEAVGIWIGQSSRNTVSHNRIHDLFYTAITVGWTWGYGPADCDGNRIEFNHLHHIGQYILNDLGGVYTLGRQTGAVIRNNLIHDVTSFGVRARGIYLDEGSEGILVENNVVYACKNAGFHQHYGRDNVVRNNIFAFNQESQFTLARAEPHRSYRFERNIVYHLAGRLFGGPWAAQSIQADRNLYFSGTPEGALFSGRSLDQWRSLGRDTESLIADPKFVDPGRFDFTLKPDSPALRLGFKPIDLSSVGPRDITGLGSLRH